MIYSSYQVKTIAFFKSYLYLWPYPKKGFSAGGTVWSGVYYGSWRSFWEIFEDDFGGLMIYSSYQVKTITFLKSYLYLWLYPKKGFSAGGTVWSGAWHSTASITVPGGRSGRFLRILAGW